MTSSKVEPCVNSMDECSLCVGTTFLYRLECRHEYCMSCIKRLSNNQLMRSCPACTAPITKTYFNTLKEQPEKIRRIGQINEIIGDLEWVWLYEGRNIGWWIFDIEFQEILEENYITSKGSANISTGGVNITVDFYGMLQINTHNSAVRKVLRIQRDSLESSNLIIKGIAGMK